MNPIKLSRLQEGVTQAQLANLAGITPQVVLKAEQGLYGLLPPSLLPPVARYLFCSEAEVQALYRNFQAETRLNNRGLILENLAGIGTSLTFKEFREIVGGSVAGFCRVLCLHPAQWQRLEERGGDVSFFRDALRDGSLEWLLTYVGEKATVN